MAASAQAIPPPILYPNMVFTRYLYIEHDVGQALATNILLKNKQKAHFWTEELFQSELIDTLVSVLWNIYFTYYFELNPEFYNYLLKQTKIIRTNVAAESTKAETEAAFHNIVANLLIRPRSVTVLRAVFSDPTDPTDPATFLETSNIAPTNRKKITTLFHNLDKLRANTTKVAGGTVGVAEDVEQHARTALLHAYTNKHKMVNKLFVTYEHTPTHSDNNNNDKDTHASMSEELSYTSDNPTDTTTPIIHGASECVLDAYRRNWIFYASRSPLWRKRIELYGGNVIDNDTDTDTDTGGHVNWTDDDLFEEFHQLYGYDTDEQPIELTRRNLAIGLRRKTAEEYGTFIAAEIPT